MLQIRSRLVSFRLSEEEYQRLKNVCLLAGARSISDFARMTLCQINVGRSDGPWMDGDAPKVKHLIENLERLNSGISKLAELTERLNERLPMALSLVHDND